MLRAPPARAVRASANSGLTGSHAERERPGAADLSGRPGHRDGVVEGELGEALKPRSQRDPQLHAGQVGAQGSGGCRGRTRRAG